MIADIVVVETTDNVVVDDFIIDADVQSFLLK